MIEIRFPSSIPSIAIFGLLALLLVPVLACSGGDDSHGVVEGPSFLLTSGGGLDILSLNSRRDFLPSKDGSYFLDPAVSPDEETYAYISQPPAVRSADGTVDFGSDLMLVDSDGKNARLALAHATTGEFIRYPVFLADENAMLVGVRGQTATAQPDFRIERLDLGSGTRTRIIDNANSPALNPDGRTLAYVSYDPATGAESLQLRDLQTQATKTLVKASGSLVLMQNLSWSPDGKVLAFMSSDLTTGAARPVVKTAFAAPIFPSTHPTLQDLWLVNADGSNLHKLVDLAESSPSPAWDADGKTIYVMGGGGGFFKVDPATGDRQILSEGVNGGQIARLP